MRTVLFDQSTYPPAHNLSDHFREIKIGRDSEHKMIKELTALDLVFPALEDFEALNILKNIDNKISPPIVFDWEAYNVTRSKKKSREFFARYNLPRALPWPQAEFPVIIKPSESSGSQYVYKAENISELKKRQSEFSLRDSELIIEEYLSGPAYSMEVIAAEGNIHTFLPTRLKFADDYDCCQVLAGEMIPEKISRNLNILAKKCADRLNLQGIMDLEVIASERGLKIMEIDARFPSQTPITVYEAGGSNMVEVLARKFLQSSSQEIGDVLDNKASESHSGRSVIYEQIKIEGGQVNTAGEHIISRSRNLRLENNFFEADKAITNYTPGSSDWQAILIFTGDDIDTVREKRKKTFNSIKKVI